MSYFEITRCLCVCVCVRMSPGNTSGSYGEPLAVRKAASIRRATVFSPPLALIHL